MFRFILSFFTKKQTLDSSSNIISNIPSSRSIQRNVAANNPRIRAKAAIGRALFFARFSTDKSRLIRPIAEVTRENYHAGTNENYRGYPSPSHPCDRIVSFSTIDSIFSPNRAIACLI